MKPDATAYLRQFFKLRDYCWLDEYEAESCFRVFASISTWAFKQKLSPCSELDSLFEEGRRDEPGKQIGVVLYLSTLDPYFFDGTKRMLARDLVRRTPNQFIRQLTAFFLTSDPPRTIYPTLARNVALTLAISVGRQLGWRPTESLAKGESSQKSGCGHLSECMAEMGAEISYSAIEKVWKGRRDTLICAGFSENDISDFFDDSCPMTGA